MITLFYIVTAYVGRYSEGDRKIPVMSIFHIDAVQALAGYFHVVGEMVSQHNSKPFEVYVHEYRLNADADGMTIKQIQRYASEPVR